MRPCAGAPARCRSAGPAGAGAEARIAEDQRDAQCDEDDRPVVREGHSIGSPLPFRIVAAPKLDEISQQQAERQADEAQQGRLRRSAAERGPRGDQVARPTPGTVLMISTSSPRWKSSAGPDRISWRLSGHRPGAPAPGPSPSREAVSRCVRSTRVGEGVRRTERAHATAPPPRSTRLAPRAMTVAPRGLAEGDQAGDSADRQAGRDDRPEIAPQRVHAGSRASSRQPMSRRWKPSAKSIASTAR